ncbi:prolipoprotein diacylglyceryl transferase, partial [bacterium]|nr:prolipoprotein diacylglyceryl transferase [bacterium]
MMQILFRIPVYTNFTPEGIPVYGFGMMLFIAFIVCTWLAGKRAVAKGIEAQIVHDLSVWIFVAGLLGARTLFLYEQKLTLTEFLMNFPRIWDGGIILYGSVLGGTLGFFAYWFRVLRPRRIEPLLVIDILAPSVALGIAIGRIGCLM